MGESAGASSVCFHMVSPNSKGLFSKGILESSGCYAETNSLTTLHQQASRVETYLNCSSESLTEISECLRNISTTNLLAASNTLHFSPNAVVDGKEIPQHPYIAISTHQINPVPLISGNVLNEGTLFVYGYTRPVTNDTYNQYLIKQFAILSSLIHEQYPCNQSDCWSVMASVFGDFTLVCPTLQLANSIVNITKNNYAYVFTHQPAWSLPFLPYAGAFHSSEIAFVFSTLSLAYFGTPAETVLSNQMTQLWTNFGTSGNPNLPHNITLMWPSYSTGNHTRLRLDTTLSTIDDWKISECQFWDLIYKILYTTPHNENK